VKNIIVLFGFIFSSLSFAQNDLSKIEFTNLYVEEVKSIQQSITVKVIEPLKIEFIDKDGFESTTHLDNAYSEYINSPNTLDEIVKRYAVVVGDMKNAKDKKYPIKQIFPVLKDFQYIREISKMLEGRNEKGFPFYYEKLNDVLYILYAFDTETSLQFVTESDIKSQFKIGDA